MELSSLEGRLLAGRFQLGERLGQGGYGAVFKAEQVSMGRPCAVKVLAPHLVSSDETVKRFELEARATSRLTHSNTIVVYDFGRDAETGLLFLAMEYLDGDDLDQFVKRRGPLSVGQALHILEQMAGSLQDAHDAGLVHRDVKPKNAMVTERGADPLFVKLIDFGISKAFDPISNQRASFLELTETGMVVGTPQYMSPEQLRNDAVDGRSDQYSLAITAYRILTGRTPFMGASLVDVAVKHISETPLPLRAYRPDLSVNADFEGVLLQALSKDPDARFDTMLAFASALRASADGLDLEDEQNSSEPWAEAETGSMPFPADVADETEDLAGEAIAEHVEPDAAFAPTDGMEAQNGDVAPVHLGGTLARNMGQGGVVHADDVPGSTLVVLRDASGGGEAVESAVPGELEQPNDTPAAPAANEESWTMGTAGMGRPRIDSKKKRAPSLLVVGAILSLLGLLGAVGVATLASGDETEIAASVETPVEVEPTDPVGVVGDNDDSADKEPGSATGAADEPAQPPGEAEGEAAPSSVQESSEAAARPEPPGEVTETADDESAGTSDTESGADPEERAEPEAPGTVNVVLVPWGDLYVDGKGRGDATRQRLKLEPGTYVFELRQNSTTRDKKRVRVKSGASASVTLRAR